MTDAFEATRPLIGFGPRVRKSPFFAATLRWGCKAYSVYNHMYMPLYDESPVADFWKLVSDVTVWDVAVERQVEIAGPDAARFTQFLTCRDLSSCAVGQAKYVLLTDEAGGIVNDPVLLKLAKTPPARHLVGLEVAGAPLARNEHPWPLSADGRPVGKITSAAHSPRLAKTIALALVGAAQSEIGSELDADCDGDIRRATVVAMPFHDPKKHIATG